MSIQSKRGGGGGVIWSNLGQNMDFFNNKKLPKNNFLRDTNRDFLTPEGDGIQNFKCIDNFHMCFWGHRFSNELWPSLLASILSDWREISRGTTKNAKNFFAFGKLLEIFILAHISRASPCENVKKKTSFLCVGVSERELLLFKLREAHQNQNTL